MIEAKPTSIAGTVVLSLTGELDHAKMAAIRITVLDKLREGRTRLLLDLTRVTYLDGLAIGFLYEAAGALRERGWLGIVSPSPHVYRILDMCGVFGLEECRLFWSLENARREALGVPSA